VVDGKFETEKDRSLWSRRSPPPHSKSRDCSVGTALGYGLDDRGSRVRFPAGAGNFFLHHRVQNRSGAHPPSYPVGTRGSFPGGKAAEAWSWPLTSIYCRGQECVELYLHSGSMPSWRGVQLKHKKGAPQYLLNELQMGRRSRLDVAREKSSGLNFDTARSSELVSPIVHTQ
jgi:hypothetical protein